MTRSPGSHLSADEVDACLIGVPDSRNPAAPGSVLPVLRTAQDRSGDRRAGGGPAADQSGCRLCRPGHGPGDRTRSFRYPLSPSHSPPPLFHSKILCRCRRVRAGRSWAPWSGAWSGRWAIRRRSPRWARGCLPRGDKRYGSGSRGWRPICWSNPGTVDSNRWRTIRDGWLCSPPWDRSRI